MANVESVPEAGDAVTLETQRGHRTIPVTLHFAAVRQIREALEAPTTDHTGSLFGVFTAEAIAIQPPGEGDTPIGLYRAQPGGWPALTEADLKKMRDPLPTGGILLVIRTLAQRPWSATLYTVDFFQPNASETPLVEFPFDEYLLRNGWLTELAPPPPPARPIVHRSRFPISGHIWIAAGVAALLLAFAAWWWLPATPPDRTVDAPPAAPSLGLKVARSADDLEFSWSRDSHSIRLAAAGTVTIRNGSVLRTINITPEQLREGRVVYHPISGVDVDMRLEVLTADGKREAESVQFLGFDTAPLVPRPVHPSPRLPPPPRSLPVHNAGRVERNVVVAHTAAPNGPRAEPVPIRRANPDLSRDVQSEMRAAHGKVSVSVLASIDSAGTVQSVKVLSSTGEPSPSGPYIRLAALNAARQWRFRPATAGGRPIASQTTLVFNF